MSELLLNSTSQKLLRWCGGMGLPSNLIRSTCASNNLIESISNLLNESGRSSSCTASHVQYIVHTGCTWRHNGRYSSGIDTNGLHRHGGFDRSRASAHRHNWVPAADEAAWNAGGAGTAREAGMVEHLLCLFGSSEARIGCGFVYAGMACVWPVFYLSYLSLVYGGDLSRTPMAGYAGQSSERVTFELASGRRAKLIWGDHVRGSVGREASCCTCVDCAGVIFGDRQRTGSVGVHDFTAQGSRDRGMFVSSASA